MLIFGAMTPLKAECVEYVVFHTAGAPNDIDQSAESIHRYHRSKGWAGIGYHWVIRKNGDVEVGRPVTHQGAHVAGINDCSIGIAFSGNGDISPLTAKQLAAGVKLAARLVLEYGVALDHVIGHREINRLVLNGTVSSKYLTKKSCPGTKVSPAKLRAAVARYLEPDPPHVIPLPKPPPEIDKAA